MYQPFKGLALRIMKAPTEPPDPPAGSHESVQVYRASPKYLTYRFIGFWIVMSVLWIAWWVLLAVAVGEEELPALVIALVLLPPLLVFQFLFYFSVRIDYDMRYYIVTDRSMRVREGALIVKEMTITYANVQNIRVVQGPILRLLGIWNLKVDTAGGGGGGQKGEAGSGHSIQMAGIENAHAVRDLIQGHLRRHGGGSGLGDLDDAGERRGPAIPRAAIEALRELRETAAGLRRAAEA